jgi:hypothetical protein
MVDRRIVHALLERFLIDAERLGQFNGERLGCAHVRAEQFDVKIAVLFRREFAECHR